MSKGKTSISKASSYQETAEFWSEHDLADFWDKTEPAEFDVEIESEKRYYPLECELSHEVNKIAHKRGISIETLLNLWVKDKINELNKSLNLTKK